jgi:tRNA U34 5-methylaminomethyl-2-thiouridine-forming methyltransferase MnmC
MPEIITTADGSHTLYHSALNETYHSKHGAINEALHVFINNGLDYFFQLQSSNEIKLLEIGFGTGLNCLLTGIESQKEKKVIHYTAIEAFPLAENIISKLNYTENFNNDAKQLFYKIHTSEWNKKVPITSQFLLNKYHITLQQLPVNAYYDIIYYDAFGPRAQPEMWTKEILTKTIKLLKANGIFVTYCAKGEVKRIFKETGLKVETLPGPPGKREMIRVINYKPI